MRAIRWSIYAQLTNINVLQYDRNTATYNRYTVRLEQKTLLFLQLIAGRVSFQDQVHMPLFIVFMNSTYERLLSSTVLLLVILLSFIYYKRNKFVVSVH